MTDRGWDDLVTAIMLEGEYEAAWVGVPRDRRGTREAFLAMRADAYENHPPGAWYEFLRAQIGLENMLRTALSGLRPHVGRRPLPPLPGVHGDSHPFGVLAAGLRALINEERRRR